MRQVDGEEEKCSATSEIYKTKKIIRFNYLLFKIAKISTKE